jgi:hypothetical protein
MRVRMFGLVAAIALVGLAALAAAGFGGEGPDIRSFDPGYSTSRIDADDVHRVAAPSAPVSTSALGEASKKKGKPKLLFFETDPATIPPGGTDSGDFPCPQGKVVTGYFFPGNAATFLGLSAPSSRTSWLLGVTNTDQATATESILGVVCAKNVK